jgi:hypothetical protein
MKRTAIIFILLFIVFTSFSQQWSVGGRYGFGIYSMGGLKDFQEFRLEQTNLPLLTTDNYPVTPNYRFELAINDLSFIDKIGAFYAFNSTGARSTRSDYSGRVDLDAILNGNQLGLTFQKVFQENNSILSGIYFDGSYLMSSLKMKDYLKINASPDIVQKENYNFNSHGIAAELGMMAKYRNGPIELQLTLGYLHDFSGKLFLNGNKDQWLAINNSEIKTDWGGIRFGIQVSYLLKKKQKLS